MGLDCSHNAWHGSYSSFNAWRKRLAEVAGLPPLELMEGFYVSFIGSDRVAPATLHHGENQLDHLYRLDAKLPIKWSCLTPNPLYQLLHHSDCDGDIKPSKCVAIADELDKLVPLLDNWHKNSAIQFSTGLRLAAQQRKSLLFR
jgi:hypothetical protein